MKRTFFVIVMAVALAGISPADPKADNPASQKELAASAFRAERWQEAIDRATQAIKERTEKSPDPVLHYYRAMSLIASGQRKEAEADLKWALKDPFRDRGVSEWDIAVYTLKNPKMPSADALALARRFNVRPDNYQIPTIIQMYDGVLAIDPKSAEAYYERAQLRWAYRKKVLEWCRDARYWKDNGEHRALLATHSAVKILLDIKAALSNGMDYKEPTRFFNEVKREGTFVLDYPPLDPVAFRLTVLESQFNRPIDSTSGHAQLMSHMSRQLYIEEQWAAKRKARADYAALLYGFGDLFSAIDIYSGLIQETECEHEPGEALPKGFLPNQTADWYLGRGKLYDLVGKLDEASLDFAMAIAYRPGDRALVEQWQAKEGRERVVSEKIRNAPLRKIERLHLTATVNEGFGNKRDAIRDLDLILQIGPNPEVERQRAALERLALETRNSYAREKIYGRDYEFACRLAREVVGIAPSNATAWRTFADAHIVEGEPKRAEANRVARQVFEWIPAKKAPWSALSRSFDLDRDVFQTVLECDRGIRMMEKGRPEAGEDAERTRKATLERLLICRAATIRRLDRSLRDLNAAIADLDRALAMSPDDLSANLERGACQVLRRDQVGAIQTFQFVLKSVPELAEEVQAAKYLPRSYEVFDKPTAAADLAKRRALKHLYQNDPACARQVAEEGVKRNPQDAQLLGLAGRAAYLLKDPQAIAKLEAATRNDPKTYKEYNAAQAVIGLQLVAARPPMVDRWYWLAEAYLAAGRHEEAAAVCSRSNYTDFVGPREYMLKSKAFLEVQRYEEAYRALTFASYHILPAHEYRQRKGEIYSSLYKAAQQGKVTLANAAKFVDHVDFKSIDDLARATALRTPDPAERLTILNALIESDDPIACREMGRDYMLGRGVPRSFEQAKSWFAKSPKADAYLKLATDAELIRKRAEP